MNPITVLYFGDLMTKLEIGREQLRLPASVKDIAGLMRLLAGRGGAWQQAFGQPRPTLRITLNKKPAQALDPVQADDEIAFIEGISL